MPQHNVALNIIHFLRVEKLRIYAIFIPKIYTVLFE